MKTTTILSLLLALLLVAGCTTTGQVVKVDTVEEEPVEVAEEPVEEVVPEDDRIQLTIEVQEEPEVTIKTFTGRVTATSLAGFTVRVDDSLREFRYYDSEGRLERGDRVAFEEDINGKIINLRKI